MSKCISIDDESYKAFQAALILTGEEESIVLERLIDNYTHQAFESVMKKTTQENVTSNQVNDTTRISAEEQKQQFIYWFRSLTRNGKPYNPVTISGYAGRIENACKDPIFSTVPVNNLFTITDITEFDCVQKQIKSCSGYAEFDAKLHNGFTAALRKYEEFLKCQGAGNTMTYFLHEPYSYTPSSNVHRWTAEEDETCCRRFLEYYVINKSDIDTVQFLKMLAKEVPDISEGSLRMKIQNIKYLTVQAGLKDSSTIKGLSQCSAKCEKAFRKVMNDLNISV